MRKNEYIEIHEQLGCGSCYYSDPLTVFKGPCCTHMRGPDPDGEYGPCLRHRPVRRGVTVGRTEGEEGLGACQGYGGGRHG